MKNNITVSGAIIGIMTIVIISLILFIVDLNIGVFNVFSLIAIDIFIIWIYFKIIKFDKSELKFNIFAKKENILIIIGLLIILVAVSTPFMIIWLNNYKYSLEFFGELGAVGDFFGGTTVGLLSLASLLFVTAAMFMQKEELELQRKEVTATRKEYEITNITMKKQSFDSTFFNMINLHQSILSQVRFRDLSGRLAFEEMYNEFKNKFDNIKYKLWWSTLFDECFPVEERNAILLNTSNKSNHIVLKNKFKNSIAREIYGPEGNFDKEYEKELYESYNLFEILLENPETTLKTTSDIKNRELFSFLAESNLLYNEKIDLDSIRERELSNLSPKYKKNIYEEFYNNCENEIGHYYRNLYRIVKYIQEYEFSTNTDLNLRNEINFKERKEYRGILRAQLSSYELLMLFYNVCYSEKGEKFKSLLNSTNFFDNHLVEEDFIWENDIEQLTYFKNK